MRERAMTPARRYLLGQASEDECAAIEQRYFRDEAALDEMAAEEDELIEEYLEGRLSRDERQLFERSYLASPLHRRRVETIRQLSASARAEGWPLFRWLAVAAALLVAVGAGVTIARRQAAPPAVATARPSAPPQAPAPAASPAPAPATPAAPAPRVFAFSLSPITVRGADDSPSLRVPPDTDVVALQLGADRSTAGLERARVVVQVVGGPEVWQGPATTSELPGEVAARVEVPASVLTPQDYIVTLLQTNPAGIEQEWNRYVLRVRSADRAR